MSEHVADEPHGRAPAEQHTIEVIGWFDDRTSFKNAVQSLLQAGFDRTDLSVLDSHESLSAAQSPREVFLETMSGLVREATYIGPITAAGLIAVATGPVGALISGAVGAGLTGYAVTDILREVRATPHTEAFARAAENGAILLWVRADDPDSQAHARRLLLEHGAEDVHTHERPHEPNTSAQD